MNKPFKIIFKYKNSNNIYQYNPYIYIGKVPPYIFKILNKFDKLSLMDTLKTLKMSNIKELVKFYGDNWYTFFFIYNHIKYSIDKISLSDKKLLIKKYGNEWIKTHLNIKNIQIGGDDSDIAINENKNNIVNDVDDSLYEDNESDINEDLQNENNVKILKTKTKKNKVLENLIKKTNIINKNQINNVQLFDTSKNNNFSTEKLSNIHNKIYITNLYIHDDDDLMTIKKKVCTSILNDVAINKDSYILPSRQYIWSQYTINGQLKNYMLGHKFENKNENLELIHAIPNNKLENYYNINKKTKEINDYMHLNLIKLEDMNDILLYDLKPYMNNYEIFMIDIYHEFAEIKDYDNISDTQLLNLYNTYIKLYFPSLQKNDILQILNYLNNKNSTEFDLIKINYNSINLKMVTYNKLNTILSDIIYNYDIEKYHNFVYITLANIKTYIHTNFIDLWIIFENLVASKEIPFIRYHTKTAKNFIKIQKNLKNKEKDKLLNWIDASPVGITLKIYLSQYNIYVGLRIYENGKIEYSSQWKESDNMTIDDIKNTYKLIINIIKKISNSNPTLNLIIPKKEDFYIEFINAIQVCKIPHNININYNLIKTFSKYFFPYIIFLESDEMKNKTINLLYIRLSKYEKNISKRLENNIKDIITNYDYKFNDLIEHIVKQLNVTREVAIKEINNVQSKYKLSKRKNKNKNSSNNLPKYKQPGINIQIQGSVNDKYIIRITGSQNEYLLFKITQFFKIFIYILIEIIYLKKNKPIKLQLDSIVKINSKLDIKTTSKKIINKKSNIKQLIELDQSRFGFIPKKGKSNYSRMCLKEYQPRGFKSNELHKLKELGYEYNEKEDTYIYKSKQIKKKKNKFLNEPINLNAIKLKNSNNGEDIYYVCHPSFNTKNYQFISFQDLSKHPTKQCMPCCNKQIQSDSRIPSIRNRYEQCTGQKNIIESEHNPENFSYISKNTNKLSASRLGLLPDHLDIFLNTFTQRKLYLKDSHFLEETIPSYFIKYGIDKDNISFIKSIAICINKTYETIINDITNTLKKDTTENIFISLYDGKIKIIFDNIDNYLKHIKLDEIIDFNYYLDIIHYIYKINIFIFTNKHMTIKIDDKNTTNINEISLECNKNITPFNKIYKSLIIINENNYFNPIIEIIKKNNSPNISTKYIFNYSENSIINHILNYYKITCNDHLNINNMNVILLINAINIFNDLIALDNKKFIPTLQLIDNSYQTEYLIIQNQFLLPVFPYKIITELPYQSFINKNKYLNSFNDTYLFLVEINNLLNNKYDFIPKYILYSKKQSDKLYINYIKCNNNLIIDIKPSWINTTVFKKLKLIPEFFYTEDSLIDAEIIKGNDNIEFDDRLYNITYDNYNENSYELLRLHLSNFFNTNKISKNNILDIINSSDNYSHKSKKLYNLLIKIIKNNYNIINNDISSNFLKKYIKINKLELCNNDDKSNQHCSMKNQKYIFNIYSNNITSFMNTLINELLTNPIKKKELLQIDNYYVTTLINRELFTERENQVIIREDILSYKQSLYNIFGNKFKSKTGKKIENLINKFGENKSRYLELNIKHTYTYINNYIIQPIKINDDSLLRAYVNGFFWIKNKYNNEKYRNLGYYHPLQTLLVNYFKPIIIDNLLEMNKIKIYNDIFKKYTQNIVKYSYNLYKDPFNYTECIPELLALQNINKEIPIFIYNHNTDLLYIIHNVQIVYNYETKSKINKMYVDDTLKVNSIHLKFITMPNIKLKVIDIFVMYYIKKITTK